MRLSQCSAATAQAAPKETATSKMIMSKLRSAATSAAMATSMREARARAAASAHLRHVEQDGRLSGIRNGASWGELASEEEEED